METNTLSFDGKGINGPDEYRSRLATFANSEAAQAYGPLFAAAPDLLDLCCRAQSFMNDAKAMDDITELAFSTDLENAIAKATQGGAV